MSLPRNLAAIPFDSVLGLRFGYSLPLHVSGSVGPATLKSLHMANNRNQDKGRRP